MIMYFFLVLHTCTKNIPINCLWAGLTTIRIIMEGLGILFEKLSFVNKPPQEMELECPICFEIMANDPRLISCCGHHFCGPCIGKVQSKGGSCPLCKSAFSTMSDKGLARKINSMVVYCTHADRGCTWKGTIKDISSHLAVGKREGQCLFAEAACRHFRCNAKPIRSKVPEHENECPLRPFTCIYCNMYTDAHYAVISNHYRICSSFPMKCPNDCGEEKIPRDKMQNHLKECLLEVMECEFKWAGCSCTDLKRNKFDEHMKSNVVEHLTLVSRVCRDLKRENEELKRKISRQAHKQL